MGNKSSKSEGEKIELLPDGWKRFEGAIDVALKSAPKHKNNKKKSKTNGKTKRQLT